MVIWLLRRSASTCLRSYWPFASAPPILIHTGAHFLTSATISGSRVATFWMWCTSRRRNYIHFTAGEPPLHERVSDRHTRQEARGKYRNSSVDPLGSCDDRWRRARYDVELIFDRQRITARGPVSLGNPKYPDLRSSGRHFSRCLSVYGYAACNGSFPPVDLRYFGRCSHWLCRGDSNLRGDQQFDGSNEELCAGYGDHHDCCWCHHRVRKWIWTVAGAPAPPAPYAQLDNSKCVRHS